MNTPSLVLPHQGEPFRFGAVGGRFRVAGEATDQRFVAAQLPEIPPGTLGAPLHRHHNEDECAFVVKGALGTLRGDEVLTAEAGTRVVKPRGQWHTFWNAGDTPCHILQLVSPAGFESYFREVAEAGGDLEHLGQINAKYAIDLKFDGVPELCERFGLTFPEL